MFKETSATAEVKTTLLFCVFLVLRLSREPVRNASEIREPEAFVPDGRGNFRCRIYKCSISSGGSTSAWRFSEEVVHFLPCACLQGCQLKREQYACSIGKWRALVEADVENTSKELVFTLP